MSASAHNGYIELERREGTGLSPVPSVSEDGRDGSLEGDRDGKGAMQQSEYILEQPASSKFGRFRQKHLLKAWRLVVGSGALAGSAVLLINIITLIVVYARYEIVDFAATVYTGSCSTSAGTITSLHLVINVLSSVLLGYSNFSMQCLSSPTREEVNRAHAKRHWLSIGTPNIRNLFYIAKSKAFLWLVLGLSSFPLHLLWNSAVFQVLTANEYVAVSVTEDFLKGADWSLATPQNISNVVDGLQSAAQNSSLTRLENADCIRAYGQQMQHDRRNVLLVVNFDNSSDHDSVLALYHDPFETSFSTTFSWMCGQDVEQNEDGGVWACDSEYLKKFAATKADQWIPDGSGYGDQRNATVQYCLSETVPEQCKISFVPVILIIVVACNVIKIVAFVWTLHITQKSPPLITTGDAIQSFLRAPDPLTKGRCLVAKQGYETRFRRSKEWRQRPSGTADIWSGGRYRWGKAVRGSQWTFFMLIVSTGIILSGAFYGPDGVGSGTTETWPLVVSLGIGQPQTNFDLGVDGQNNLLTTFIAANIPQIVVSYVYLALNNIMTTMLAMAEWTSYTQDPAKGLRVSSPKKDGLKGEQRSTYFLSVPLRWAIPTMIAITTLHWLVSEMVFPARIDVYDMNGNLNTASSVTTEYFSPLAMLLAVSLGAAIVLILIGFGIFKRYPSGSPLAGCCSASISAACHPANEEEGFEENLPQRRLKWGVVDEGDHEGGIEHATFSRGAVKKLIREHLYA